MKRYIEIDIIHNLYKLMKYLTIYTCNTSWFRSISLYRFMASAFCLSRSFFSTLSISLSSSLDLICSSFSSFNNLSSFNLCSTTTVKRDCVFETNRRFGYAFYPKKYPAVATTGIPADANTNRRSGGRCPVPPECRGTRIPRRTRPGPCTRNRTTGFYLLWKPLLKDTGWLENKHK